LQPLGEEERRIYDEMKSWEKRSFTRINAFRTTLRKACPTIGAAAPAPAISTSAKTD